MRWSDVYARLLAAGLSFAQIQGLTLGQVRELSAAAARRERQQALLGLYIARAAQLDAQGYRQAWEQLSGDA